MRVLCYILKVMISLRKLGYSFLALLILSGLISVIIPQTALAQSVSDFGIPVVEDGGTKYADAKQENFTVRWLDAAHIQLTSTANPTLSFIATPDNEVGGQSRLYDQRHPGVRGDYSIDGWPCSFSIAFDAPADEHTPVTTVILEDMEFRESNLGDCIKTRVSSISITTLDPQLSIAYFRRVNDTTIERADSTITYVNSQKDPNVYTEGGRTDACTNRLVVNGDLVKYYSFGGSTNDYSGNTAADAPEAQTSCKYRVNGDDPVHLEDKFIRNNFAMPLAPANDAIEPGGGLGGTDAEQQASCETYGGGGGLSWVACPLINIADNTTSYLDAQVTSLLQVPKSDYDNPELKQTWERIRNVALIILVPIMLVMVISTALGFNFIDAYTIKKSLPRLVVAVMFIVLSWWITVFLLDLTNDVGKGILGLMTNAFGGPDSLTLRSLFDPNALEGLATAGSLTAGAGIFLYILVSGGGLGIVLSFGFTTLLALFIVFLVLTIRQMLLIALTLFAPLAILSWIFPSNNKLWKLWWETFSKLLLMFPIIMIIIASGRIFAAVIGSTGGTLINTLLKLIAYIAPYFFIPATFKIAGGLFATLSGVVNDRGRGLFDRGKKYRQTTMGEVRKDTGERLRAGKFIKGASDGTAMGRFNKRAQRYAHLGNVADTGITRMFKDGRGNISSAIQSSEKKEQKHIMEDEDFNTWAGFDDVSGMAGDVILGNERGIRRRLMKVGVGVQRNADGSIARDANGNLIVDGAGGKAMLDRAVSNIMTRQKSGDRQGALRQGLIEAGTFIKSDGTLDTAELDKNVSHVMRASRKYGDDALSQALVKKAGAGGTYYDNAADAWTAANLAAGHDGAARADFGASFRGILTNAGRVDQGGGAFGKTLTFMDDLGRAQERATANGTTVDVEIEKIQKQYMQHVKENNPASVMFHHSMKEGYLENNVIPIFTEEIQRNAAAAAGKSSDSPEYAAYMKSLADADNIYQQALATKPALAKIIGDKLMNLQVGPPVQRTEQVDTGLLDAKGNKIIQTVVSTAEPETVRSAGAKYRGDPVWQRYHKEWISSEDALRNQAQAQAQAQAQQGGPGSAPGAPMGPTLGPPR